MKNNTDHKLELFYLGEPVELITTPEEVRRRMRVVPTNARGEMLVPFSVEIVYVEDCGEAGFRPVEIEVDIRSLNARVTGTTDAKRGAGKIASDIRAWNFTLDGLLGGAGTEALSDEVFERIENLNNLIAAGVLCLMAGVKPAKVARTMNASTPEGRKRFLRLGGGLRPDADIWAGHRSFGADHFEMIASGEDMDDKRIEQLRGSGLE